MSQRYMPTKSTTLGKRPETNIKQLDIVDDSMIEMQGFEAQVVSNQNMIRNNRLLPDIYIDNLEDIIRELVPNILHSISNQSVYNGLSHKFHARLDSFYHRDISQAFNEYYSISLDLQTLLVLDKSTFKYTISAQKLVQFLGFIATTIEINTHSVTNTQIIDSVFLLYAMIGLDFKFIKAQGRNILEIYVNWILLVIKNLMDLNYGIEQTSLLNIHIKLLDIINNLVQDQALRSFSINMTMFDILIQLIPLFSSTAEQALICHKIQGQSYELLPGSYLSKVANSIHFNVNNITSYSSKMRKAGGKYTNIAIRLKAEEDEIQHSEMGTIYLRTLIINEMFENSALDVLILKSKHQDIQNIKQAFTNLDKLVTKMWIQYVTKTRLRLDETIVLEVFLRILAALSLFSKDIIEISSNSFTYRRDTIMRYKTEPENCQDIFYHMDSNRSGQQYEQAYIDWARSLAPKIYAGELLYMEIKRAYAILDCRLPIDVPCIEDWWHLKGDLELIQAARDRRLPAGEYADILNRTRVVTFTPFVTTLTAGLIALIASVLEKNQKLYTLPLILIGLSIDILYSWGCIDGRIGTFMWKNVKQSWTMFSTQSSINKAQSNYYTTQKNGPMAVTPSNLDDGRESVSSMIAKILSLFWYKDTTSIKAYSLSDATNWLANAMSTNVSILDCIIELEIFYTNFSQWENNIRVLSSKADINGNRKFSLSQNTPYGSSNNNRRKVSTIKTLYGKHSVTITGSIGQILKEKAWLLRVPFGKEITEGDNHSHKISLNRKKSYRDRIKSIFSRTKRD